MSITILGNTAETSKALRLFKEQVQGVIRSNSKRFKAALVQIEEAENPLKTAKKLARDFKKAKKRLSSELLSEAVSRIYKEYDNQVTTATIDAVVSLIREGYSTGYLDPQHEALIDRFEKEVLFGPHTEDGKVSLARLKELAAMLIKLDVYDAKNQRWASYQPGK